MRGAWEYYQQGRDNGYSPEESGRIAKVSAATQAIWERCWHDSYTAEWAERKASHPADSDAWPIADADLSPRTRDALGDFSYFRLRYLGRRDTPWQRQAAEQLRTYLESPDEEFVVVNCPPGSGKSTLFTHDIPLWLLCRDRSLRCMVGSRTERQAAQYVARIRRTLMMRIRADGAETTLMHDFGSFRPAERDLWRRGDFVVAQPGVDHTEKESTFSAFGFDSAFLGGRFDLVVWDDLVDRHALRTAEAREAMQVWFETEAESRLEPGGLFVLQGQRLAGDDLYRYALDLKLEDGSPKYRHIVFRAHDDEHCDKVHARDAPPWPSGCLLDPVRVPWRTLAAKKLASPFRYRTVYQQEDGQGSGLVHPGWIDGGTIDGVTHRGCWDPRSAGAYPPIDAANTVSYVGVDPSPTKDWALFHAVYDVATESRHVIDLFRGPMEISGLLDFDHGSGRWRGIMEEWQIRSEAAGFPIRAWIIEVNAAQRFLIAQSSMQRWATRHRCDLMPHTTTSRKSDPDYGPQILAPLYRHGLARLPGASRERVATLVEDVTRWTPDSTLPFDALMAQWFTEVKLDALAPAPRTWERWTPSWVGGSRAWVAS